MKTKVETYVAILSLIISLITLLSTSPFIFSSYIKPKLVYSNTNGFWKHNIEGTIFIKNVGKSSANDVTVFLLIQNTNEVVNGLSTEMEKDASFENITITRRFLVDGVFNNIENVIGKNLTYFPIKEIPANQTVGIRYKCNKKCSIPFPKITYSEGEAKEVKDVKF